MIGIANVQSSKETNSFVLGLGVAAEIIQETMIKRLKFREEEFFKVYLLRAAGQRERERGNPKQALYWQHRV